MKKLIMLLVIVFIVLTSFSQEKEIMKILSNEIVEQCDGTIFISQYIDNLNYDKYYFVAADLSEYYSEDVFKSDISVIVSKYTDVKSTRPWKRDEDGGLSKILLVNGDIMLVKYLDKDKGTIIIWLDKDK